MKKLLSLLLVLGIGLQAGEAGSARVSSPALNGASPSIEGFLSVGEVQAFFLDLKQPQNIQKPQIHCHLCSFKGTEKWHMELHMQEHAAEALEDDMGEAFINQNGHVAIRDKAGDIVFEELDGSSLQ